MNLGITIRNKGPQSTAGLSMPADLLAGPGLLGTVPFDAGLGRLLFATINIHHFMLDGAIWKLCDGPVARAVLRAEPTLPEAIAPSRNPARRRIVWAACAAAVGLYLLAAYEIEFGVRQSYQRGDRLLESARKHLERSPELFPTAKAWTALGNVERLESRFEQAIAALETAIELDPRLATAHKRLGEAFAGLEELDAAMDALLEAGRLDPNNPNIQSSLRHVVGLRERAAGAARVPGVSREVFRRGDRCSTRF